MIAVIEHLDTSGHQWQTLGACGGRLRLIATLHDPAVIRKILAHVGTASAWPSPSPVPPRPSSPPPRPDLRPGAWGALATGRRREALITLIRPVHVSVDRLTAAVCRPRMPLSRAGSRHARRLLMCTVPSAPGRAQGLLAAHTIARVRGGAALSSHQRDSNPCSQTAARFCQRISDLRRDTPRGWDGDGNPGLVFLTGAI
jgi:hypothetical protein